MVLETIRDVLVSICLQHLQQLPDKLPSSLLTHGSMVDYSHGSTSAPEHLCQSWRRVFAKRKGKPNKESIWASYHLLHSSSFLRQVERRRVLVSWKPIPNVLPAC